MKAAGLNPMLAFSQGGASTPSVSAAKVEPVTGFGEGVHSAASKAMQTAAIQQQIANIGLTEAATREKNAQATTAEVTSSFAAERQHYELSRIKEEVAHVRAQYRLTEAQMEQLHALLPQIVEQQREQIRLARNQANTAEGEAKLKQYQLPSARAEAEVWEKLGAAGRGANIGANALQQVITIIRSMLR